MATSVHVHVHDHVNVHELRPRLTLHVDVVVDVIGFFIWLPLGRPRLLTCKSFAAWKEFLFADSLRSSRLGG